MNRWLTFSLLAILWNGCLPSSEKETQAERVIEAVAQSPFTRHATAYEVEEHGSFTVVRIPEPWKGASQPLTYYLVPRTQPVPDTLPPARVVRTPVKRVAAMSTTYLPMIEMAGGVETVIAFPNTSLISTPAYVRRVQRGELTDLGSGTQVDRERLLALEPEVVFGFSIGQHSELEAPLRAAGIPLVYNADFLEQTPLGRAEWVRFFGLFFQNEEAADEAFRKVEMAYNTLREKGKAQTNLPTVFSGNLYGGTWYMPGGNSWVASFFKDAGAQYLWADNAATGSMELSVEAVINRASEAEYWVMANTYTSKEEMLQEDERYRFFDAFRQGRVYNANRNNNAGGGNLYLELGYARPDLVLKDMLKIFHPEVVPDHELFFFQKMK